MAKPATQPAPASRPSHPPTMNFGAGERLVRAVPALHGQWRFAALVRRAFALERPDAIAVELPRTLEDTIRQGVARLPWLTVVAHDDFDENLEKIRQIVPIIPDDALIEAVRLGVENGVPVHFIDRDELNQRPPALRVPDDYLVERLGVEAYWKKAAAGVPEAQPGSADDAREAQMAAALRSLPGRRILFVCGLAHLGGVMRHFAAGTPVRAGEVTQRDQKLYALSADSVPHVLGDLPHLSYTYELARRGLGPEDFPQLAPLPLAKGGEFAAAQEAWRETRTRLAERLATGRAHPSPPVGRTASTCTRTSPTWCARPCGSTGGSGTSSPRRPAWRRCCAMPETWASSDSASRRRSSTS